MNLKEVREYTESLIKSYFKPKVLKKFDEDTNGNLTYDGNPMSAKVSGKPENAIEVINDINTPTNDGLFVEDLRPEFIRKVNIAQKTINEGLDYILCSFDFITLTLNTRIPFTKVEGNLEVTSDTIKLNEGRTYKIDIKIPTMATNGTDNVYKIYDVTNNIEICKYNPITRTKYENGDTCAYVYTPQTDCEISILPTLVTSGSTTRDNANIIVTEIGRVATIDPVNYIDTTQGIQDVPVGTLINTEGPQNPEHYLLCDGTEYNIVDYRDLAEAIKKVYGRYNYFGGDGTITFAVPKYVDTNKWFSPKQTSNSNPYNVSASSSYSSWQVWWGFNNSCTTSASNAWHSAVGSTTGHWVQIDFKTIKPLNGISMAPRPEGNYNVSRMPRDFDIMGSNDGTTWNTIKSYTGINDYENYKYREFIFDRPEKYRYYRIANIVVTGDCVNIADIHFLEAPEKYIYIKATPTYFIGGVNGYEEIRNLTNGFIDLTLGTLNYRTTLLESIENFDKVEATIEGTWASTGTKLGLKTHYFNVADIKERYVSDGNWKHGNQLNYIDTIIDRDFNYITAIFMDDKTVNLSCYGDTSNISALHIRLRGIVNHYKVKSTN